MNRRKFLLGSAATLTGSGLLVGSQGYSRVESQRTVQLQVEDDEDAYLGLGFPKESVTLDNECETSVTVLEIRNQTKESLDEILLRFGGDFHDITVSDIKFTYPDREHNEIEIGEIEADDSVVLPEGLGTGKKVSVGVTIECPDDEQVNETQTIGFGIEARGDDTEIVAQRDQPEFQVSVTCDCLTVSDETAYGYGGDKSGGQACSDKDNPFGKLFADDDDSDYCHGKWGWYVTRKQIEDNGWPTLYAGAGNYNLDKATKVGKLSVTINDDETLCVNFLDEEYDDKLIEFRNKRVTVVKEENKEDILNNGGKNGKGNGGVAPGQWEHKITSDKGKCGIDISEKKNFVLAAHTEVTITESGN